MAKERFSRLAPLDLQTRTTIVQQALRFFGPLAYKAACEIIGKTPDPKGIRALSARDFVVYLTKTNMLPDAERYQQQIREFLEQMARVGLLVHAGSTGEPLLGNCYFFVRELTDREKQGSFWLAPALGAQFLQQHFSSITIQITGKTSVGDAHAGTGLLITPTILLTCAHVLTDMTADETQTVQGGSRKIVRTRIHEKIDVALVEFEPAATPLPGFAFHEPQLLDEVYVLGYPKIPFTRNAALVIHKGEVTSTSVIALDGTEAFLFSAIARPGNSGGPIISHRGHVVGLVSRDFIAKGAEGVLPFYGGVATSTIVSAVRDLDPNLSVPLENYE